MRMWNYFVESSTRAKHPGLAAVTGPTPCNVNNVSLCFHRLRSPSALWEQARRILNPCIMKVSVFESFKDYLWKKIWNFLLQVLLLLLLLSQDRAVHTHQTFLWVFHELEICIRLVFTVKKMKRVGKKILSRALDCSIFFPISRKTSESSLEVKAIKKKIYYQYLCNCFFALWLLILN